MAKQKVVASLRKRWSTLRREVIFLPPLQRMSVNTEAIGLEAIEYVRVVPTDEEVMVPSAPHVPTASVVDYPAWSDADADQLAMWPLVGVQIEGDRTTLVCPDCDGTRAVTCHRCHGGGRVSCTWCSGSGYRSCSGCGGSGGRHVTRSTTDASGNSTSTTEWETCSSCGGSGRDRCNSCWGSGRETCSTCRGGGEVECETCSPEGTLDRFIRRTFVAESVAIQILPVILPGYPGPIGLSQGHVAIQPRAAAVPYDLVADQGLLTGRDAPPPEARLFFIRPTALTLHSLVEPQSGRLCATFIDGSPAPILTLHQACIDPGWSPDQERQRALLASLLYGLSPLVLLGFGLAGVGAIGPGSHTALQGLTAGTGAPGTGAAGANWALILAGLIGSLLLGLGGSLLYRGPIHALRMAFRDPRCTGHGATAPIRCPACAQDLCPECLSPVARCPHCGRGISQAVTHLVEAGRWVPATGVGEAGAAGANQGERGSA